jgi:hypothetical protein
MYKLQHNFLTKGTNILELFDKTEKLSTFLKKLEKQSGKDPDRYPVNKYLGDGFEFFVEILLKLHPCDNRLGVYEYRPEQTHDHGVDGSGLNIKLEKCVVQIKYRSNNAALLTATEDKLSNLFSAGDTQFKVSTDHENPKNFRHFIFTTADGLHFYTDTEMYQGRVKCFGIKELKSLVDNNLAFWKQAKELVKANLEAKCQK